MARAHLLVAIFAIASSGNADAARDNTSVRATHDLIDALGASHMDAIAAADPLEDGAFVAALHIKGAQLLVVRAKHPSVDALAARLTAQQFREVYLDLQATPTPQGKLFVMDSGADGLPNDDDQPKNVDVVYADGTRQTMFNGARAQQLSADGYRKELQQADAQYTRLLNVLTAALTAHSPELHVNIR